MSCIYIEGGHKLNGEIDLQGAKNSCLPILAATLVGKGVSVIHNCPKLSDVEAAIKILTALGCKTFWENKSLVVDATDVTCDTISEELMREMRSSIVFLGAIISRMKTANLSAPGGCELGPRPIDLHIYGLKKLGVDITEERGYINCKVTSKLKGTKIVLPFPSVGATENIMIAAVMAQGQTTIHNAAQEPEIIDLANYLNSRGAKIKGAGKSCIVINGVNKLKNTEHTVMPDRIVAATYLSGVAMTGGDVIINHVNPNDLESIIPVLEEMGSRIFVLENKIRIISSERPNAIKTIRTMPYPGFPTDAQAPLMALSSIANGTSIFVENIFENRYKHAVQLNRMGADIKIEGKVAIVKGVNNLYGATVCAEDLRGGASLILAGLVANGTTKVLDIHHIERGYESIEKVFGKLGAKISKTDV